MFGLLLRQTYSIICLLYKINKFETLFLCMLCFRTLKDNFTANMVRDAKKITRASLSIVVSGWTCRKSFTSGPVK